MVLGKLDILERAVDLLVVALEHADAQQHDAGEVAVAADLLQVRAVEQDLILVHKLARGGEEHVIRRAFSGGAELESRVLLQYQLAVADVLPFLAGAVGPDLRFAVFKQLPCFPEKRVEQFHRLD